MDKKDTKHKCLICGREFGSHNIVLGSLVREQVARYIRNDYPDWNDNNYICIEDLSRYRVNYVHALLQSEMGELTTLENEVLESLHKHEIISSDVDTEFEREWTTGEKLADYIAEFGGSWKFIIIFGTCLFVWIGINTIALYQKPFDPYPYILLNLVLSCLAAIQAPIIMMSQNRQEDKDRLRSQHDYQVNLKAELEIRHLHEKIDHLLSHQWDRMIQIQEIQLDILSELRYRK